MKKLIVFLFLLLNFQSYAQKIYEFWITGKALCDVKSGECIKKDWDKTYNNNWTTGRIVFDPDAHSFKVYESEVLTHNLILSKLTADNDAYSLWKGKEEYGSIWGDIILKAEYYMDAKKIVYIIYEDAEGSIGHYFVCEGKK